MNSQNGFAASLLAIATFTCAGGAQAQSVTPAGTSSNDIVVTARRVEERLQDVPISLTVFTQEQIQARNITNVSDLATYTPSLQSDTRFGATNATFAIRGFRQDLRTSPAVGVYFADVIAQRGGNGGVQAGEGAGPGSFFDLQNVQVLKGPQGTLFGRNTTGGAILLVPQKPTGDLGGFVELNYGKFNQRRVQAVVNAPLGETVRLRVGIDWNRRDGYLKNITGIGPLDFNDIDYVAGRASLVVDLAPTVENYTIASFSDARENGVIAKITECGPNTASPFVILCQQQLAREAAAGGYRAVSNGLPGARNDNRQWQVINTTTVDISDNLRIKNIVSYGELVARQSSSLQGAAYLIPSQLGALNTSAIAGTLLNYNASFLVPGGSSARQKNFVEELQLQGKLGGDLFSWQMGAYYEKSSPLVGDVTLPNQLLVTCTDMLALRCNDTLAPYLGRAVGNLALSETISSFRNAGVYAQGTYKLTDRLNFTAGIRYTWDKTTSRGRYVLYRFAGAGGVPLATPLKACAIAGPNAADNAALLANDCRASGNARSSAPTWLLSLDYKRVDDVMVYAKYSRGYRQGSYLPSAPLGFAAFSPEKIDAYEMGLKSSFDGAVRGTLNIAAFYNKLSNQQIITAFASSVGAVQSTVVATNVGKSRVYGIEVDASISPFPGFTFDANYAYLNTRVTAVNAGLLPTTYGPYNIVRSLAIVGARFGLVPSNKYTLTATYELPVPESVGKISVSGNYAFTDDFDYANNIYGTLPSVGIAGANLNWRGMFGSDVDMAVYATNLFNKKYFLTANDNVAAAGFVSRLTGEPRMYGVRLRYTFGR